jgi:hypothetical protein
MAGFRIFPLRILPTLLLLAGCAQISGGIDWYNWTQAQTITGKMRTDRRPDDAPVTRQILIDNFRAMAFDFEDTPLGRQQPISVQGEKPHLRKWLQPIRYELTTLPEDSQFASDIIVPYMHRLATITSHGIEQIPAQPDKDEMVRLFIMYGPDELFVEFKETYKRTDYDERTGRIMLNIVEFFESWRFARSPCDGKLIVASSSTDPAYPTGTVIVAVVVIKREIPRQLFEACVEEELAQIMGLINDDPEVRPTIFNDDQEFALLTEHDEYLLKILYDDRLEPGMAPQVAMPIVRQIVEELLPDG